MQEFVRRMGLFGLLLVLTSVIGTTWILMDRWQTRLFAALVLEPSRMVDTADSRALPDNPIPAMGDAAALIERPLFMQTRRPPLEEETQTPVAPPKPEAPLPDLSDLRLTSIIITPEAQEAWFRSAQSEHLVRLEAGATLREWTLREVAPSHVVFEARGSKHRVELRTVGGTAPDVPAAERAVPRGRN